MASIRLFLENTDHLGDRELYEYLRNDQLREPSGFDPEAPGHYSIDFVGSGSRDDLLLYLKHYADYRQRRIWAEVWPQLDIPDHEDPPSDRDRRLPQPDWIQYRDGAGQSAAGV